MAAHDIYYSSQNSDGTFTERVLTSVTNSFVICGPCGNLTTVTTESFSGGGGSTVKVSLTDVLSDYLGAKLVAGTGISITTQSLAGVETIRISVPGSFSSATISINGSTYYEVGTSQTIAVSGTITSNSETSFGSGSIRKAGADWYTFTSASSYSTSDSGVTTATSYVTYMQVGNDGTPTLINSSTKTATFIYPFLWGTSATAGLNGSSLYTTLTKSVTAQGTKTANLSGTGIYVYFTYPVAYGALSSIKDQNNFELISSFEVSSSVSVTSVGLAADWTTNFYVYRTKVLSNGSNPYTFTF